ncbi:MAG: hypothetical protein ACLFP8_02365 [Alphaproteobacteria bacterium]
MSVGLTFSDASAVYLCRLTGHRVAMQTLGSLDELYEYAPEVDRKYGDFLQDLSVELGCEFKQGPLKERAIAENKIDDDYEGNEALISDIVRGKLVVDSVEALQELLVLLDPQKDPSGLLKQHGMHSAQMNNYFAEPKYETGYRCLNVKLAVPLDGMEDEYFLVELQVVHKDIEATYDTTHKHMREAQNITNACRDRPMTQQDVARRHGHYAVCRFHNASAARQAGLDVLLNNPGDAPSDERLASLDRWIRHHRFDY